LLLSKLIQRARFMRQHTTPSEAILWRAIRRNQLGVHFRRQHILVPFIVDFFCAPLKLVVEVDGPVHFARAAEDAAREQFLTRTYGVRFVRVSASTVERNVAAALAAIRAAL